MDPLGHLRGWFGRILLPSFLCLVLFCVVPFTSALLYAIVPRSSRHLPLLHCAKKLRPSRAKTHASRTAWVCPCVPVIGSALLGLAWLLPRGLCEVLARLEMPSPFPTQRRVSFFGQSCVTRRRQKPRAPPSGSRAALQLPNSAYRPGRTNRVWNRLSRRLRVIARAMATIEKIVLCNTQRQSIYSVRFVANCRIHLYFTTSPTVPGTPQRIASARW